MPAQWTSEDGGDRDDPDGLTDGELVPNERPVT
jgi:hypothetical protein